METDSPSGKLTSGEMETRKEGLEVERLRITFAEGVNNRIFDLSQRGLKSGAVGVGLVFFTVLVLIVAAYWRTPSNVPVFSGWNLVAIIFILVGGLVIYFSLVFRKEVKLAAELSKDGAKIDMGSGKDGGEI